MSERERERERDGWRVGGTPDLDVLAVGREVHLDDAAWDVLAVADAVEGGAQGKVIEVHGALRAPHRQETVVWAETSGDHTKAHLAHS